MALAHVLSNWLGQKLTAYPSIGINLRSGLRLAVIFIFCFIALLLFLFKLSQSEWNVALGGSANSVDLRLVKTGIGRTSKIEDLATDDLTSWSLYNRYPLEATNETENLKSVLKIAPNIFSWIQKESLFQCRQWQERIENLLELKIASGPQQNLPDPSKQFLMLVCLADPQTSGNLEKLRAYIAEGGSVLFLGPLAEGLDTVALSQLLQVRTWRSAAQDSSVDAENSNLGSGTVSVTFGGSLFSWGGMPAGFRLGLGKDWANLPGRALAEAASDVRIFNNSNINDQPFLTPLIARSYVNGKVAWTSLPANLSNRLEGLYGPYWDMMVSRILTHLARLPMVGVESLPANQNPLIIPVIQADYDYRNTTALNDLFKKLEAPASFFLVMTEALANPQVFGSLQRSKQEIGANEFDHEESHGLSFFEQVDRYIRWKKGFDSLWSEQVSDLTSFQFMEQNCCQNGVALNKVAKATTYAAIMANRFDYVIGDPFTDWITPYKLALDKTKRLRDRLDTRRNMAREDFSHDEIVVVPVLASSDYQFFNEGSWATQGDINRKFAFELSRTQWMGGPYILPIHSQVLGSAEGLKLLKSGLESVIKEGAHFMRASDYASWWERKSSAIQIDLRPMSDKKINVRIAHIGTQAAVDLVVRLHLDVRWRNHELPSNLEVLPSSDESIQRLKIKEMKVGQVLDWSLVRE